MMVTSQTDKNMKEAIAEDIVYQWDKQRKANKGKWLFLDISSNGFDMSIKSYNEWLQIIQYPCGLRDGGMGNCSITESKQILRNSIMQYLDHYAEWFEPIT